MRRGADLGHIPHLHWNFNQEISLVLDGDILQARQAQQLTHGHQHLLQICLCIGHPALTPDTQSHTVASSLPRNHHPTWLSAKASRPCSLAIHESTSGQLSAMTGCSSLSLLWCMVLVLKQLPWQCCGMQAPDGVCFSNCSSLLTGGCSFGADYRCLWLCATAKQKAIWGSCMDKQRGPGSDLKTSGNLASSLKRLILSFSWAAPTSIMDSMLCAALATCAHQTPSVT